MCRCVGSSFIAVATPEMVETGTEVMAKGRR